MSEGAAFSTATGQCRRFTSHTFRHEASAVALAGQEGIEGPPTSSVCPGGAASSNLKASTGAIASPAAGDLGWESRAL